MKNYAGHRLSPWLGHLMVSRQETARPLLTPGEVMQLPADDELVLVSGCPPIRAKKVRYFRDRQLNERVIPPPKPSQALTKQAPIDDWSARAALTTAPGGEQKDDQVQFPGDLANGGIRREPELLEHEDIAPPDVPTAPEFVFRDDEADDEVQRARILRRQAGDLARQVSMDPGDGMDL
jgi:type IV secretion system protein VirD4